MHPLFKPLRRIYLILLWSWLLIIFIQILFIAREFIDFSTTGIHNDTFGKELIRVSLLSFIVWLTVFVIGTTILISIANKRVNKLTEETLRSCKVEPTLRNMTNFTSKLNNTLKGSRG